MPKRPVKKENKRPQSTLQAKKPITSIVNPKQVAKTTKKDAKKIGKQSPWNKRTSHLFQKRPKNFGIGKDIQPRRDLTRYVRWPLYIQLQRKKRVLKQRLKVPPVINQFTNTIDKNTATKLFSVLSKIKPETEAQRKKRLKNRAAKLAAAKTKEEKEKAAKPKKPHHTVKKGLRRVTSLVEQGSARLVVIAHDVEPIEVVMWLPTLCKKKGIPYLIVKGKARLGAAVNLKTCTCLAITSVPQKQETDLNNLISKAKAEYIDKYGEHMKTEGGLVMGNKYYDRLKKDKRRAEGEKAASEKAAAQKAKK